MDPLLDEIIIAIKTGMTSDGKEREIPPPQVSLEHL